MINAKFESRLSSFSHSPINGLDKRKIDLYQKVLSKNQIKLIESIVGSELIKHGYLKKHTTTKIDSKIQRFNIFLKKKILNLK